MNWFSLSRRSRGIGCAALLAGCALAVVSCESAAERIAVDIGGIRARLEASLRDVASIILQAPVAPGSVAAATAMAGMLSALRDADRMLNGEDLAVPAIHVSPVLPDVRPATRPEPRTEAES